jgi:hypothetical protein
VTAPRTILLANTGQRDVQDEAGLIDKNAYRTETARLLGEVRAAPGDPHERIRLPIIEAPVRALLEAGDGPLAVTIVGTDQDPASAHHADDTVHAAAIIAALLPARFPGDVAAATAVPLAGVNPSSHDDAYRAFQGMFRRGGRLADLLGGEARIVVAFAASTPAANLGLLLAAVEACGDRVRAIQPREGAPAAFIDIAATIRRQALLQPAGRLLREGQFGTAAAFIEAWGDPRAAPVARLARALHRWQDYDIAGALADVEGAAACLRGAADGELPSLVVRMRRLLEQRKGEEGPRPEPTTNQVIDLLWGADLCRAQGRLVDFVARAARLNEAILRRTATRAYRIEASDRGDGRRRFWERVDRVLGNQPGALAAQQARTQPRATSAPDGPRQVNVPGLQWAIQALADARPTDAPGMADIVKASRTVDVVRDLHNQSIAGHDFRAVTDAEMRIRLGTVEALDPAAIARLGTDGEGGRIIVEAMARLLDVAGLPAPRTNFFLDRFGVPLADALAAIDA